MKKLLLVISCLLVLGSSIAQETSTIILDEAYKKAQQEDKVVWILFSASWCDDCKVLEKKLQDETIKTSLESQYIFVTLIVHENKENKGLETPGAEYLLNLYMGKKAGLPFWLIFDKHQGLIGNSFNQKGKNSKLPKTEKDVEAFINTIKKTSSLHPVELEKIKSVFLVP